MNSNRQTGMTLIEILIVLLVVSVGMAATAKFQGDLLQAGANTKARTQALSHAQSAVEALRISHGSAADGSKDDISGSNAEYQLEWEVTDFADAKQYSATVSWDDANNESESVQLDTVLYADIMLSGDDANDENRGNAAECVFLGTGCGFVEEDDDEEVDNTPPDVAVTIDTDNEEIIETPPQNTLQELSIAEDNLQELKKKQTQLTGNDYISKLNGSGSYTGTNGDDKFLVDGKTNGAISLNMLGGDDVVQINDKLTGSAWILLGSGDDLLILHDFKGSAQILGGDGTDIVCFSGLSSLGGKTAAIHDVEILLFNDGSHQFANGYTTDESNIPIGCGGSGGGSSFVYQYPVTVELIFPTEESAGRDDVALVENNTASLTIKENDNLIYNQALDAYDLYLYDIAAEEGTGENAGKFVKEVTFTLESPYSISDSNTIKGCTSWEGENFSDLKITLQDSACE